MYRLEKGYILGSAYFHPPPGNMNLLISRGGYGNKHFLISPPPPEFNNNVY